MTWASSEGATSRLLRPRPATGTSLPLRLSNWCNGALRFRGSGQADGRHGGQELGAGGGGRPIQIRLTGKALIGFRGGEARSRDQACDKGAEQGSPAPARIVNELKEA